MGARFKLIGFLVRMEMPSKTPRQKAHFRRIFILNHN